MLVGSRKIKTETINQFKVNVMPLSSHSKAFCSPWPPITITITIAITIIITITSLRLPCYFYYCTNTVSITIPFSNRPRARTAPRALPCASPYCNDSY